MAVASTLTVSQSLSGLHLKENFAALLETNLDLVRRRVWNRDLMGLKFFKPETTNKDHVINQDVYGMGLVPRNRDSENLPLDQLGLGFQNIIYMVTYRLAVQFERETMDDDQYGQIGPKQVKFLDSLNKTIEYTLADCFNNGFGTAGSAPFICNDGLYLFDSARNNPHPGVAQWSNLETAADLTEASLWTMEQNFAANKDERGHNAPLNMGRLVIPKALEKQAYEFARSAKAPEDAMNRANYFQGLQYDVWNYLTDTDAWFGFAGDSYHSEDNEMCFYWRDKPGVVTYDVGNPDIVAQRQRSRWAFGAGRPSVWRGNTGAG